MAVGGLQGSQGCLGHRHRCLRLLSSLCGHYWHFEPLPHGQPQAFCLPSAQAREQPRPCSYHSRGCLSSRYHLHGGSSQGTKSQAGMEAQPPSFSMPLCSVYPRDIFLHTCILERIPNPTALASAGPPLVTLSINWMAGLLLRLESSVGWGRETLVPPLNIAAPVPGLSLHTCSAFLPEGHLVCLWVCFPILEVGSFLRKMSRLGKRFWPLPLQADPHQAPALSPVKRSYSPLLFPGCSFLPLGTVLWEELP